MVERVQIINQIIDSPSIQMRLAKTLASHILLPHSNDQIQGNHEVTHFLRVYTQARNSSDLASPCLAKASATILELLPL